MTVTWKRTTREKYWEMLEILPPACMSHGGFLVGEPWSHTAEGLPTFEAYVEIKGTTGPTYWVSEAPMTIAEFRKSMHAHSWAGTPGTGITAETSKASHHS